MKTIVYSISLLLSVGLLQVSARDFGVSTSSAGRGTKVTTSRGGTAYVGPRGAAAQGAGGTTAVAGRGGAAAVSGENGVAVRGRQGGAVAVGDDGVAARGRYGGAAVATDNGAAAVGRYGGAAVATNNGAVAVGRAGGAVAVGGYTGGAYIRTVPAGARVVAYGGYNCYYVGGVYYRPVIYQGATVYVVVN